MPISTVHLRRNTCSTGAREEQSGIDVGHWEGCNLYDGLAGVQGGVQSGRGLNWPGA